MHLWEIYINDIHDNFGNLFANWLPASPIKLGDYGTLRKGLFERSGNLAELGIVFEMVPDSSKPALYEYRSSSCTSSVANVGGSADVPGAAKAKVALDVKFSAANSVFFNASGCKVQVMGKIEEIGNSIRDKLADGVWNYDWVVITKLVKSQATTILIAGSDNASILLEAKGDIPNIDVADASLRLGVRSETGIGFKTVTEDKLTPLYGCHKMHWSVLGEDKWKTRYLRQPQEENGSQDARQVDALRQSGDFVANEFGFAELAKH